MNGNGKQDWRFPVDLGCVLNVDSEFDLKHIAKAAKEIRKRVRVLVRLNPNIDPVRVTSPH